MHTTKQYSVSRQLLLDICLCFVSILSYLYTVLQIHTLDNKGGANNLRETSQERDKFQFKPNGFQI